MSSEQLVSYETADAVAIITMDDGRANALGTDMIAAIDAALDRAESDDAVRAVIIAGREGR